MLESCDVSFFHLDNKCIDTFATIFLSNMQKKKKIFFVVRFPCYIFEYFCNSIAILHSSTFYAFKPVILLILNIIVCPNQQQSKNVYCLTTSHHLYFLRHVQTSEASYVTRTQWLGSHSKAVRWALHWRICHSMRHWNSSGSSTKNCGNIYVTRCTLKNFIFNF